MRNGILQCESDSTADECERVRKCCNESTTARVDECERDATGFALTSATIVVKCRERFRAIQLFTSASGAIQSDEKKETRRPTTTHVSLRDFTT
jgi:hypothetical protein